ncbi:hypothetical protein QTP88_004080 [Uroleucon formosanum]
MRRTRDGHLLVELAKGVGSVEAAQKLSSAIATRLGEAVGAVCHIGQYAVVEIIDLDAVATEGEVLAALRAAIPGAENDQAAIYDRQSVQITGLWSTRSGQQIATARMTRASASVITRIPQLLKQTVLDQAISVVLVSEQLCNPMEDANWVSSDDNRCAVVAVGHSVPPIEDRDSGTGFAWIKLGSLVIYSCYYTPNCSVAEFEEYRSRSEDSIRVHRDCQVVVGGT